MNKTAKIITACAACVAAAGLCGYVISLNRESNVPTVSEVKVTEPVTEAVKLLSDNWDEEFEYVPSQEGISGKAKLYMRKNKDVAGWIRINKTILDNPVVLDPGDIPADSGYGPESYDSNSYYLDHDLEGAPFRAGTLFMDYRNVFGSSEEEQSDNIVIYGHNMANNTMFGSIRRYRQDDYKFYDESPFIELSSNYKDYQYIIFGFLITSGSWQSDFCYWNMEDFGSEEEFNGYVEKVRAGAMIDTGVDVKYGDQLLTLSTCYANEDNSRFIVVARRLRDGETAGDINSIERTPEYIQKQKEEEEKEKASGSTEASSES